MSKATNKPQSKPKLTIRVTFPVRALIHDMLDTLNDLGSSGMARIDARLWAKHYAKRAKKLGLR